ncbi:4'-phosphopantetheinyl transferase family protein [Streptomyces aidingensis]|uniref:4'-phosphopantetheinyl transferase n=1 Tax=Streptomyces aidingensis TaxID=910347 RepID=A0A1I1N1Q5_9ACTN|nr:4'-phosphopantetheinyl transferase superfamily protein [Streptomyces aidingensis]SFC88783.1 4'-phosphopantetheinyl transferase [Streptomyces aidingensis]
MIAPGEVHLWLVPVHVRPGWPGLLDAEEQRRAAKLEGTPARDVFLTSRAAQRLIGSHYLGARPSDIVIERGCPRCPGARHGRPVFQGAAIDYSVSHTRSWLLLALTGTGLVGVDIEEMDSFQNPEAMSRTILSEAERAHFAQLTGPERARWLLAAWTRKEAALKLTGLGLRAWPHRVDVSGATVRATAPEWPSCTVHLYGLAAPDGHASALATTEPLVAVHRFELPESMHRPVPPAVRAAVPAASGRLLVAG